MNYNFRNTTTIQVESQDELRKKIEAIIKQFSLDREQNSVKIGELKDFLNKNILMVKNNWDDKRNIECQATPSENIEVQIFPLIKKY